MMRHRTTVAVTTARTLLSDLATALVSGGLDVELDGDILRWESRNVVLANVRSDGRLRVAAALVFDGHGHVVPEGCGDRNVTPGSSAAALAKVVDLVTARVAVRKAALAACPHYGDNQGFCHVCGVCVNPDWHTPSECDTCRAGQVFAQAS